MIDTQELSNKMCDSRLLNELSQQSLTVAKVNELYVENLPLHKNPIIFK